MKMLLVIDMQEDFVNGVFGTPEAKAIVPKVVEYIKNFDGTVAYTADVHGSGDMEEVYSSIQYLETKLLPEHCKAGTPGCKIVPEISDLIPNYDGKDYIFVKNTFGCRDFTNKLNYVDEIELCGIRLLFVNNNIYINNVGNRLAIGQNIKTYDFPVLDKIEKRDIKDQPLYKFFVIFILL